MLQAPLYEDMLAMPRWEATWLCAQASAGDAMIALAAYGLERWSYAPGMPRVLGVGVAPIAQWIIVPLLVLWVSRLNLRRAAIRASKPTET